MNTKLTISLDKEVIELAKQEAAARGISLSKMIEQLLSAVTTKQSDKKVRKRSRISAKVRSLRGIVSLPPDFDHKKEYGEYLQKKYS